MDCIGKALDNSQSYRLNSRIIVVTQRSWKGASHYGCVGTFFPTLKKGLAWKQWAQERKLRASVSRSRTRSFSHPNTSKRLLRSLRRVINPKRLCVCVGFFNHLTLLTGASNDGFLLHTQKTLFRLSRVLLDLQECILSGAIKFVSVRSSQGNLSLFEIIRAPVELSRKLQMQFNVLRK